MDYDEMAELIEELEGALQDIGDNHACEIAGKLTVNGEQVWPKPEGFEEEEEEEEIEDDPDDEGEEIDHGPNDEGRPGSNQ